MKKVITKSILMFIIMIFYFDNICYADSIVIDTGYITKLAIIEATIFVGIIAFIVLLISYINLKILAKDKEEIEKEEIKKKINKKGKYMFICIAIIVLMISIFFDRYNRIFPVVFVISVLISIVIAVLARIKDKKTVAYVWLILSIVFTGIIISVWTPQLIENPNLQSQEEMKTFNSLFINFEGNNKTASDVRATYATVIASNAVQVTNGTNHYVALETSDINTILPDPTSQPSVIMPYNLNTKNSYTIKFGYDEEGYISCFSVYDETEGEYLGLIEPVYNS